MVPNWTRWDVILTVAHYAKTVCHNATSMALSMALCARALTQIGTNFVPHIKGGTRVLRADR